MAVEIGRTKFPDRNNGNSSVVYWDPSTAISGHAILVGSSGVGKTHRLRYLIRSLITNTRNINIHILDVHGDIAPAARNRVIFSEITEYGLNPLEVTTDPEFGGVRRRINSFIAMINRTTSKLGVRQEAVLRALLNDLYELNGYDQRKPQTWDPRTNPYVRGRSKVSRRHPGISDLANLAAWRIKNLLTGAGTECFKALVELQKQHRKLTKLQKKLDEGEEAALEMAKTNVKELFGAHIDAMKTGGELDDLLNYDSVDTLRAVYERIKGLDATGIFKDEPPIFAQDDPLRVYDIKALSEDEQSMFAEVLLERLFLEAKARGQRDNPDTFIIIDEAHKFMSPDNEHIMNRMAREVRKFGVGLILVSQNFDHFPEDLIANSAMTMILGLHDMHHDRAARRLGLKRENLKWIKPKQTALVQVRSGSNTGLTNTFKEVILSA
jgi:DNA helicase HerA-like ATPase